MHSEKAGKAEKKTTQVVRSGRSKWMAKNEKNNEKNGQVIIEL